jgi:hypothetical protein
MKLADLNPRWFAEEGRHGQGVMFDCPCATCAPLPRFGESDDPTAPYKKAAGVYFDRPLDGGPPIRGPTWTRAGDTFETLSLSPSVFISPPDHWHGFIINGTAVTC